MDHLKAPQYFINLLARKDTPMKRAWKMFVLTVCCLALLGLQCNTHQQPSQTETPEFFNLRPKVEKDYGYTHAVKIGDDLKISGAVSMDDSGKLTAAGNMDRQMKNCYSDLEKILRHYGYTFDDVVVENVFTTNMAEFIQVSTYRNSMYKKQFPTGTWLEVKGLALPGQLIEIDMEAHKTK
jgi:2-iminobutanoate/2-iminopropanoate deaminase